MAQAHRLHIYADTRCVRHHRENPVYAAEVYRKRKVEGTLKPRRRIQKRLEDPNPIPIIPVKEGQKK